MLPLMMAAALMVMRCQISAPGEVAETQQGANIERDPGAGQGDGPCQYVVLFDNGVHCLGQRKQPAIETRVVEYDISSDTHASFSRHYKRPDGHGYSYSLGG